MIDTVYWIWFQLLFGIATRRSELLLNYFDNPKEIFDGIEKKSRVLGMLTPEELSASGMAMTHAETLERKSRGKGVSIITPDHPDYPEKLNEIYSKPAALYCKGDLGCLKGKLAIAMVGTRHHTEYGREAAAWIAQGLALGGAVVVSGLAHGIDSVCHTAALEKGGKSVGVLGCGLDIDYPKGNSKIKTLMSQNGAVVSEFPLGTEPRSMNFPHRNRIISGICHGTVVVEADFRSGSLLTANHALEQGRDVFAVPGSIFSIREQGTHKLIREGAKLTSCAQDIFDEYEYLGFGVKLDQEYAPGQSQDLGYRGKPPMKDSDERNNVKAAVPAAPARRPEIPDGISPDSAAVFEILGDEPLGIDHIADISDLDISAILSALTELEIYGLIQAYPGRQFAVVQEI